MNVATAGMGVNTIAYIILCTRQGIKFDYILFSDPGKETPKTYEYIPIFNQWLKLHNQPEIITLFKTTRDQKRLTIYDDNIAIKSLPSIVYGYKKCSLKFKVGPFEKFLNNSADAKAVWKNMGSVNVYKGIDCDEEHRAIPNPSKKFTNVYPLITANMGRFECVQTIIDAGLPLPPKSSCTFCPSMKPWEIIELYENEPKEFYDAIAMERNAKDNLLTVKGLGRDFSWWDLIIAYKYLKLVKKHNAMGNVPDKIKKLMKKVNRSRPVDYAQLSKERNIKKSVCDLFSQNINMPCDCMN